MGALGTPESVTSPNKKLVGSVLIVEAESIDEYVPRTPPRPITDPPFIRVKAKVEADVYYTNDVVRARPRFPLRYATNRPDSSLTVGQGALGHPPLLPRAWDQHLRERWCTITK